MDFSINSMWNGENLSHPPMHLKLHPVSNEGYIKIDVNGKFFNDPLPQTKPGNNFKLCNLVKS